MQSGFDAKRWAVSDPVAEAGRVLLIGVDPEYAEALADEAARFDLEVVAARGSGLSEPDAVRLCAIGIDEGGPGAAEPVRALAKLLRGIPIAVLAGRIDTDSVVRLMRLGVADVIGLPRPPAEVASRVLEHLPPRGGLGLDALVGRSRAVAELRGEITALARTHSNVLITGETGTGKGLVARLIHSTSDRRDGPFVHLDCASLSPSLIESELFGHERGAFTGATERRTGRFELARDGTVFLDEIGELDLALQGKLLRVLQDREYERIGGTRTLPMQARVIAATNCDLRRAIDDGTFRTDLYFRLNVFRLEIPALRERKEDVPALTRAALHELGRRLGMRTPLASNAFVEGLMGYAWPGNVRELFNVLERLLVRGCGEVLDARDLEGLLPEAVAVRGASPGLLPEPAPGVDDADDDAIVAALHLTGGNVSRAARRLGLPRSTLRYRIMRCGLEHLIPRD